MKPRKDTVVIPGEDDLLNPGMTEEEHRRLAHKIDKERTAGIRAMIRKQYPLIDKEKKRG